MNEFIEQFLVEARELADQGVDDLLALEANPSDRTRLDSAFRAFHTLKGAAGIIEFPAMGRALHAAEDRLSDARAEGGAVPPSLISDGLWCLDQVLAWLDEIQVTGEPPAGPQAEQTADAVVARFAARAEPLAATPATRLPRTRIRYTPDDNAFFRGEDPLALLAAVPDLVSLAFELRDEWPRAADFDPFTSRLVIEAISQAPRDLVAAALDTVSPQVELSVEPGDDVSGPRGRDVLEAQLALLEAGTMDGLQGRLVSAAIVAANVLRHMGQAAAAASVDAVADDPHRLAEAIRQALQGDARPTPSHLAPAQARAEAAGRLLRVETSRVDALVRLAGELGVAKNALGHLATSAQLRGDPTAVAVGLKDQHARLERLTAELQRAVLNLRVLPLRQLFQRFPRLVRDMSVTLGKPAKLIMEGEAVEADRVVVEALFEPLLHVVRNALDHGLEESAARRAAGKPDAGVIRLAAARIGEQVIVEVEDDGSGLDLERIRQVAVERGVASSAALRAMDDTETLDLVFAPGFSTATEVTDLSGRGVGMDAVRAAIERWAAG